MCAVFMGLVTEQKKGYRTTQHRAAQFSSDPINSQQNIAVEQIMDQKEYTPAKNDGCRIRTCAPEGI